MRREEAAVVTAVAAPEAGCDGEQPLQPAGLGRAARGEPGGGSGGGGGGVGPQDPCGQWKKFLYSEPHKRIKEVLEEELYIKRDECHIKNPPAGIQPLEGVPCLLLTLRALAALVALEGIWSIKRNLPLGGLKLGPTSRNSLLPQAKYYSRHGGLRR
ncbi:uncharacterized protein C11orf97 homolog isoform X1 [Mustela lutreola]|uniref:uncharacterized protein C11orf97 homolog isoform X1 n=1 Tax=Mustela lutreola TaxID=9666 RepID=UPI0027974397|nr:uncharacterized protein C11orf97 homolog isoform X1 [Mustela lutreola]